MPGHYSNKKKVAMADPLPPDGDSGRHSPKPGGKPSSPYLPGKSPHKLAKKHVVNDVNV